MEETDLSKEVQTCYLSQIQNIIDERVEDVVDIIRTIVEEEDYSPVKKTKDGKPSVREFTGRQKAAIFFIVIGCKHTEELFKFFREDEIETFAFEMARLEYVHYHDKINILENIYTLLGEKNTITLGGIDYTKQVLEASLGSQKAIDILNRMTSSLQCKPFDFIRRTDPAHLLNIIQQEHPQVIALILSYLEPHKASIILQNLYPAELQSDVSRRIACMDTTSPEILREVERVLEKKLSNLSSEDYTAAGGVESIVEILNLCDRASEKQIIEALEEEDPELAEDIKKRMFIFEDIVMLDDRAIQKCMREIDSQVLSKSLMSVDSEVQDKIFHNMSKRAAHMLKEDMEYMGPVRLKDIEEAQQRIVSVIRHLEDTGEIVVARAGEDELIVANVLSDEERKRIKDQEEAIRKQLPMEETCWYLKGNCNLKQALKYVDDNILLLATYGQFTLRSFIWSQLSFFRRIKLFFLAKNIKEVWMDIIKEAQMDIIKELKCHPNPKIEEDEDEEENYSSGDSDDLI